MTPGATTTSDRGEVTISREMNSLILYDLGRRFWIPLTADPATCDDAYVASQLRQAKAELGIN